MAQLHVQKKRNQAWWLWIILILVIIAVAYYFMVRNNIVPDSLGINKQAASLVDVSENIDVI